MRNNFLLNIILCFFTVSIISSCTVESKIARNFIKERNNISVYVLKPEVLYKYNLKTDSINPADSVNYSSDSILHLVNDSILIDTYYKNFINELKNIGLKVYNDSVAFKNLSDSNSYVINISQYQTEEFNVPYIDEQEFYNGIYEQQFILNAVNLSTWFEVRRYLVSNNKSVTEVLFAEHTASDYIDGFFEEKVFSDQISYKYKRYNISIEDIYELAAYSATENANYLFDYLMNKHIQKYLKNNYNSTATNYYHYNRHYNLIYPGYKNKLTYIKSF